MLASCLPWLRATSARAMMLSLGLNLWLNKTNSVDASSNCVRLIKSSPVVNLNCFIYWCLFVSKWPTVSWWAEKGIKWQSFNLGVQQSATHVKILKLYCVNLNSMECLIEANFCDSGSLFNYKCRPTILWQSVIYPIS